MCGRKEASPTLLQELVNSGNALGVKMERLAHANQALGSATHWARRAEQAASAHEETPIEQRPSLSEVRKSYRRLIQRHRRDEARWLTDAACRQVDALLVDYQVLVVALHEAESLTKKRDEAQAWACQTKAVLSSELNEDHIHVYKVGLSLTALADVYIVSVSATQL